MLHKIEANTDQWFNAWKNFQYELIKNLTDPALWGGLLILLIKIVVILIVGRLTVKIVQKALQHILSERDKHPLKLDIRRTKTIGKLLENFTNYAVNFIMILMILAQFGVNLGPVLAGAGVVGLAIGFGAQSLVKDVITGFFIIFEDQFAVGDVIQTGTYKGTVEEIGLRVTRLKSWTGEVHIIPNGTISQVTNFSLYNSIAVIDVTIAYEADIEKAMKVLDETVKAHYENSMDMIKAPEVLGIQTLGASEVTLRVTVECKANTQPAVQRKLYAEIKRAFAANGVETPNPRVVTLQRSERMGS